MAQINKPGEYFNTKLYTGDGGGSGSSTGIGFQPDMVWSKSRTEALNHTMFDSVRGAGSNKELTPNGTSAEGGANSAGFGYISAFNSDGYSWTAGSTNTENFNKSSQNYANWCWLAGGTASSNTDGSITSSVSANTTSGFSIVSYTGTGSEATVGHGLGVTPKIVFFKRLDSTTNWVVQAPILGNRVQLVLNDTSASATDSRLGASDNWSNSVFTVGTYVDMNASGGTYIAYCFNDVQGYSKFGSYTGNGSTDGTFVYTGFKPAFVMIKRTNSTGNWLMFDSKRDGFNSQNDNLYANTTTAEQSDGALDIFSNGFKCTVTGTDTNGSGSTYIYMAFAENPLVGTNNIPATAR